MHPTLNTVALVTGDMEAAMAFYARLGLEFELDPHTSEHADCYLPGGLHVMLDTEAFRTLFLPAWSAPAGGPRALLCFEFATPADVDAKYAELTDAGCPGLAEPFDALWGMRYATVADPDGNGIDLYSSLPSS